MSARALTRAWKISAALADPIVAADAMERLERFSIPEPNTGCWLWTGGFDRRSYGHFSLPGVQTGAHRVAYALHHGDLPEGALVRHRCDNPPCVNPIHLEIGSYRDNARDMVVRGRSCVGPKNGLALHPDAVAHGEGHYKAKLTASLVRRLRELWAANVPAGRIVAELGLGISSRQVARIAYGDRWRRAGGPIASRDQPRVLPRVTHCPLGHAYAGDNLWLSPRGYRHCLTCRNEASARSYERRMANATTVDDLERALARLALKQERLSARLERLKGVRS